MHPQAEPAAGATSKPEAANHCTVHHDSPDGQREESEGANQAHCGGKGQGMQCVEGVGSGTCAPVLRRIWGGSWRVNPLSSLLHPATIRFARDAPFAPISCNPSPMEPKKGSTTDTMQEKQT